MSTSVLARHMFRYNVQCTGEYNGTLHVYCTVYISLSGGCEAEVLDQLMDADLSGPRACVHALQVARDVHSEKALQLLCARLVCHPLSAINFPASRLALKILAGWLY